jgi:hypothetical protein
MTLPSTELKAMWRRALLAQHAELVQAEGPNARHARALMDEVKTADAFDAGAADRQWAKSVAAGGGAAAAAAASASASRSAAPAPAPAASSAPRAPAAASSAAAAAVPPRPAAPPPPPRQNAGHE